jgi:hypothetical protein
MNVSAYETFALAARGHGLVLDRQREVQAAMLPASDMRKLLSNLRFIFVLAAESGAHGQILFDEFNDKMRD